MQPDLEITIMINDFSVVILTGFGFYIRVMHSTKKSE